MRIGVPKEIKTHEYRVGLTPGAVREYVAAGHKVLVETSAGEGIGASDELYRKAGADIAETAKDVFASSEMIVKVKEPQPVEWAQLREGQTPLHLPASRTRSRTDKRPDQVGLHRDRLRNRDRRAWRPATAGADERGGGPPGDRGGGYCVAAAKWRAGPPDRRRSRRAAGHGSS